MAFPKDIWTAQKMWHKFSAVVCFARNKRHPTQPVTRLVRLELMQSAGDSLAAVRLR